MGIFKGKETCPLCNRKIGLTNFKFQLISNEFICQNCANDLVGLRNKDQQQLKLSNLATIKEMYHKKGLDTFSPAIKIGNESMSMSFDDNNRMFSIKPNITTPEYKGSYDELDSYELIENNSIKTKSGLGKAIVGGVIAGPAGMITGAVLGRGQEGPETINSLSLRINLKQESYYPLVFISKKTKKNSLSAQAAWTNIIRLTDKLDEILPDIPSIDEKKTNNFDNLKNLKELLDLEIITQEEFDIKKKEFLNF